MCWEGSTYEDDLGTLKKDGVFPPCMSGLTDGASYDLKQLILYSFARIGRERLGRRIARAVVDLINEAHVERRLEEYPKQWAQQELNLRFLQWLICQALGGELAPSATTAHIQADVIDYLTMELTGQEFRAPAYPQV
jgi:hypothetical protein